MKKTVGIENVFHLEKKRGNRNNNYFYMSQLRFLTPNMSESQIITVFCSE